MEYLYKINWESVFVPSTSLAEVALRGTIIYLLLFLFLRFLLKRETGVIGIADLLVIVLIADAAQNGLGSEYRSVTEGIVLVLTIIFWNYTLDWMGYRFKWFQRFVRPAPLELIRNGRMLRRNMRQEMITAEELMSQVRQQGIDDISKVKMACMEGDGSISIISDEEKSGKKSEREKKLKG